MSVGAGPTGAVHVQVTIPSEYSPTKPDTFGGAAPNASPSKAAATAG